jgi:hypothetical protein
MRLKSVNKYSGTVFYFSPVVLYVLMEEVLPCVSQKAISSKQFI